MGDKAAMLVVNTIKTFFKNLHEIEFNSQRREVLLFLKTNMAAVANQK